MSNRYNQHVGFWLKTLRESLPGEGPGGRMTQKQAVEHIFVETGKFLEEPVRISSQELSRIEKGQTEYPSAESLCAIALGYRIDIIELLGKYGYYPTEHTEEFDKRFTQYARQFGHLSEVSQRRALDTMEMVLTALVQIESREPEPVAVGTSGNGKRPAKHRKTNP